MAHAPLPPEGLGRYVIDVKHVDDIRPYATATLVRYLDLLRLSIFSLSPPGDLWESYRTYEAIEAGSIPVVLDLPEYKRSRCVKPASTMLDIAATFIVSLQSWDDLAPVMQIIGSNVSWLESRQQRMLWWLRQRKAELRREIIMTHRKMLSSVQLSAKRNVVEHLSWHSQSTCNVPPLLRTHVGNQLRLLSGYWRRSQPTDEIMGGMGVGMGSLTVPQLFKGHHTEYGIALCATVQLEDFCEPCMSSHCALPRVADVTCG